MFPQNVKILESLGPRILKFWGPGGPKMGGGGALSHDTGSSREEIRDMLPRNIF